MLNLNSGGNSYGQLCGSCMERKVNTGRLNMNGKQESEHKAHPKQSDRKCLTVWCEGS